MDEEALVLIQHTSNLLATRTTLVLIHDSGGTTFNYFRLGQLNRPIYGISDPFFLSGQLWEGGIPQSAQYYCKLLRTQVPKGNIILGGWSFGGLVALEMAQILQSYQTYSVTGLVLIDTVNPFVTNEKVSTVTCPVHFEPHVTRATKDLVHRSMERCGAMIRDWTMPNFESDDNQPGHRPRPRAVLLKAKEYVNVGTDDPQVVASIDISRDSPRLGWEDYDRNFPKAVFEIPGHHYSIFDPENIDSLTYKLDAALQYLDKTPL